MRAIPRFWWSFLPLVVLLPFAARRTDRPEPRDFYAAVATNGHDSRPALEHAGLLLRTGSAPGGIERLTVLAPAGSEVVFWALDHGTFVANGHHLVRVRADAQGRASTEFRLAAGPGLYRVSAASRGATGCVTFFCLAPRSAR